MNRRLENRKPIILDGIPFKTKIAAAHHLCRRYGLKYQTAMARMQNYSSGAWTDQWWVKPPKREHKRARNSPVGTVYKGVEYTSLSKAARVYMADSGVSLATAKRHLSNPYHVSRR